MKRVAIVVAMQSEFDLVCNLLKSSSTLPCEKDGCLLGKLHNQEIVLAKSGIGKVNAAVQVTELIQRYHPDFLINTGVAGGIGKSIKVGDVVVADHCVYHDVWCGEGAWGQVQGLPLKFPGDPYLLKLMRQIDYPGLHFGLICTGDQFITEHTRLEEVLHHFPDGLAVDMESCAMAQVCYLKNTPYLSVRVISDTPLADHDNTTQYFDFWKDAPQRTFQVLQHLIEQMAD